MKFINILLILLLLTFGINAQVKKTSSSSLVGYKKFVATAYCLSKNKTASGLKVRPGIVAVDRRIIALGTKITIFGMGEYLAADTGGSIKGNRLDIWMPCGQAIKFGRRTVMIKI